MSNRSNKSCIRIKTSRGFNRFTEDDAQRDFHLITDGNPHKIYEKTDSVLLESAPIIITHANKLQPALVNALQTAFLYFSRYSITGVRIF